LKDDFNSPLFQYLQDLGHTDFEACSPVSQEEEPSAGGEEAQYPQDILPSHRKGGVWRLVDALRSLNPLHRDSATRWQEQQLVRIKLNIQLDFSHCLVLLYVLYVMCVCPDGSRTLLDRVSAACPFNRAGQLRSQQLIGLRKAAYQSLRCAFRASRLATCVMLKSYPDPAALGLGLGVEHLSDEQAQELTNDYSLPSLKMLFQLWVGQSSEFFRRLALLLSPGRPELDSRPSPVTYSSVPLITDSLHRTLAAGLGDLQRSYDFHRYFETQHQSLPADRNGRAQQKCRELNSLHTVYCCYFHLCVTLNDKALVIILEDDLEKLMVAKETEEMTCAGYQELKERLQLLQPHMQASTCCWDDTLAQVDRMLRRVSSCPESSDQPEETAAPDPPPPAPITSIQDRDPVPEEQELEAYVSDSDSETEWRGATDMLSPWEQERQRCEREESRRVLLELKSVLGIRTSDGERDKRKLLLFSDQAALAPFAKDTSKTDTNSYEPHISAESMTTTDNHVSQRGEENEGEQQILSGAGREKDCVTEFCCGDSDVTGAAKDTSEETVEETLLFQSDGLIGDGDDGTHPLSPRVPTLSVIDRLTELHGSEAISFSSALAAQVAARSHTFTHIQECTYGDSSEEEEVTSLQTRETEGD
uniref:Vezatin n=1 Tax=Cyprinus carpio TaxID=7962 RepID=A0A8C1R3V5_CYPCA